jgi:uncharacterized repeat protein (TIGR01451 family)
LDAVAELFGTPAGKPSRPGLGRRRTLRLEQLEGRNLLSVSIPACISGTVSYTPAGTNQTPVGIQGATVQLWLDNGSGLINGLPGGNDTLQTTTTTGANGNYQFLVSTPGTYYVEQLAAQGYVLGSGQGVQTVTVAASALEGATGLVIDSFSATTQTANAAYPSGTSGTSYSTATEAIGGGRDMSVQLTSPHGAVTLGADSTTPDALDFTTGPGAVGIGQVVWQGQATGAYATGPGELRNPTGLNHLDLTGGGANTGIELTLGADQTGTAVLTIYTDGNDWSSATITIPNSADGTATQNVFVPFSSFTVGSGNGATFTNVGAIKLTISGAAAMEAQVANIDAVGPTPFTENFSNTVEADLGITKTASPNPVDAGKPLTYTLTATNYGPSNATGVTVVDTLPAGVTYVSTSWQGTVTVAGSQITLGLGSLAVNASDTFTILVDVNSTTTGTITNVATISGNQTDPNMMNNTATCSVTVNQPVIINQGNSVDLAISKVGPATVNSGATMTYTLNIINKGPDGTLGDVTVTDPLPAGETYISSSASVGTPSFSSSTDTVTDDLGLVANQGTATVTIVVQVTAPGGTTLTNTGYVSVDPSLDTDGDPANNQSTINTLVNSSPSKRDLIFR